MDPRGHGLTVLTVLLLVTTPSLAQGSGATLEHLTVRDVELGDGEEASIPLTFRGGPFEAGWALVVNAEVAGSGQLQAELVQANATVEHWNATPGEATRYLHGVFAETATARLDLAAEGDPVNLSLYYDMSCECAGKQIPVEIADGRTVFRIQVREGATWQATFPEPPAHDLTIHRTDRLDPASRWPDDFAIQETSKEAPHTFTWTVEDSSDAYVWMVSEQIHRDRVGETDATIVSPSFYPVQDGSTGPATPLPAVLALVGLVVAAGVRRRKVETDRRDTGDRGR